MLEGKHIAIVSTNCFVCAGLKAVLTEYFAPHDVVITDYDAFWDTDSQSPFDFVFIHSEAYVLYNESFSSMRNRLIVLAQKESGTVSSSSTLSVLDSSVSLSDAIHQLEKIFASKTKTHGVETQETLSIRELEVLRLVAIGMMNKHIADQLSISTHTVISHRKNLTRKLGINTVSGLTVYALINGLITTNDLQQNQNLWG